MHDGPLPAPQTVIHTADAANLTLDAFFRDPISWLARLVCRLHALLRQLFKAPARASAAASATSTSSNAAGNTRQAAAPASSAAVPAVRRSASGRFVSVERARPESAPATRLVATQATPMAQAPRSPVPIAALVITSAAVLGCASLWFYKRWQVMKESKKEAEQRNAIKKDSLARQKQRFQRALVVDSVNLELPPIKDMDVQPGPVRVEKIISQQGPQRQSATPQRSMPGLAGESLRQWQKFMSASRATEVSDVSKSARGSRAAPAKSDDRPYVALDDRMLADLSERIRKANDVTAAGGTAPPKPVITFEQLYANNHETDDEAMARRAAERKARWAKQQAAAGGAAPRPPVAPASTAATTGTSRRQEVVSSSGTGTGSSGAGPRSSSVRSDGASQSTIKAARPPPLNIADNPFAAGLFTPSPKTSSASAGPADDLVASGTGRSPSARLTAPSPPQPPRPPVAPRLDVSSSGAEQAGSPLVRARLRDSPGSSSPSGQAPTPVAGSTADDDDRVDLSVSQQHQLQQPSTSSPAGPDTPEETAESRVVSGPNAESTREAAPEVDRVPDLQQTAAQDADQIGPEVVETTRRHAASLARSVLDDEVVSSHQTHGEEPSPSGRSKRAPAAGQLRTPDKQSPSLARLMRRPSEKSLKGSPGAQLVEL